MHVLQKLTVKIRVVKNPGFLKKNQPTRVFLKNPGFWGNSQVQFARPYGFFFLLFYL